jgi:hypothetical protein
MFDISFRARAARKTDAGGQADVILVDPERGDQPGIDSLFRRFAVEVFIVGLRVGASMVDDAVPMIRRCIERIKLQWNIAGIDDVVIGAGRDDDREARSDRRPNAVENRLTAPPPPRERTGRACGLPPRSLPWALAP